MRKALLFTVLLLNCVFVRHDVSAQGCGIITTIAGGGASTGAGGAATDAALSGPKGIAMDRSGN